MAAGAAKPSEPPVTAAAPGTTAASALADKCHQSGGMQINGACYIRQVVDPSGGGSPPIVALSNNCSSAGGTVIDGSCYFKWNFSRDFWNDFYCHSMFEYCFLGGNYVVATSGGGNPMSGSISPIGAFLANRTEACIEASGVADDRGECIFKHSPFGCPESARNCFKVDYGALRYSGPSPAPTRLQLQCHGAGGVVNDLGWCIFKSGCPAMYENCTIGGGARAGLQLPTYGEAQMYRAGRCRATGGFVNDAGWCTFSHLPPACPASASNCFALDYDALRDSSSGKPTPAFLSQCASAGGVVNDMGWCVFNHGYVPASE